MDVEKWRCDYCGAEFDLFLDVKKHVKLHSDILHDGRKYHIVKYKEYL